jgi:hypothetical protein
MLQRWKARSTSHAKDRNGRRLCLAPAGHNNDGLIDAILSFVGYHQIKAQGPNWFWDLSAIGQEQAKCSNLI